MRPSLLLFAALVLAVPVWPVPGSAGADELIVLTHDLAGQAAADPADGALRGLPHAGKRAFNLEAVREIMAAVGLDVPIHEVSFAQGMKALGTRPNAVFFNIYRTPQREARFKWVGPLQREVDYLYGLNGGPIPQDLDAAGAVPVICAVDGSQHYDVLLEHGFANVVPAPTYRECFQRLKTGAATLAVSSDETLRQKLHVVGIPPAQVRRVPEPLVQSAGYIAFSPGVDDAVIRRWQAALNGLISSGRFQALYDRYYQR